MNVTFCRFDGLLSARRREEVLETFQADDSRVLLVTFGTAATGYVPNCSQERSNELCNDKRFSLNTLSIATRVYLMEPQWNPSIESQAIGRVTRFDQANKVTIVRYLMQDSIEKVLTWAEYECRKN